MLIEWVRLLLGAVAFGAAIVVAMVAPRPFHLFAAIGAVGALVIAVAGVGMVVSDYATAESVALAVFFLLAGIVGGYWILASMLPWLGLARTPGDEAVHAIQHAGSSADTAVLLLADAQPERYDARAVAQAQHMLTEYAAIDIPATAAPFMFLSEKTRYRAIGGALDARATGRSVARGLAQRLESDARLTAVYTAWTHAGASPDDVLTSARMAGARQVVVTTLGSRDALAAHLAWKRIEAAAPADLQLLRAPSLWRSTALARGLSDRILANAGSTGRGALGVVMVAEGEPPSWTEAHPDWAENENYFSQRVRLHLCEHGVLDNHVRTGWMEWHAPDVTETVRHLAALGCKKIIVVPGLIPLPSLATGIDLEHSVRMARLNPGVSVLILPPWGYDEVVVDALAEGVMAALDER